jgi:hypothetical protein
MQLSVYGIRHGSLAVGRSLWSGIAHRLSAINAQEGTPVYEKEWDLLILLDACRVDALKAVASEYEFLPERVPSLRSVAPNSHLWLEKTFQPAYRKQINNTAYITANGHADGFADGEFAVSDEAFHSIEKVYNYGFDDNVETIPPRTVTDATIHTLRNTTPPRAIAHYMQPHTPYRGLDLDGLGVTGDKTFRETVWDWIASGRLSRDEAWEYYLDNLRWVLDDLEVLLENVNADRVIISADHGEAFGEWGAYGHSPYGQFSGLRETPWVEATATDSGSYFPDIDRTDVDVSTEEQLKHLGYR